MVSLALLLFGCGGQAEQASETTIETSTEAVTEETITEETAEEVVVEVDTSAETTTVTVTETAEETAAETEEDEETVTETTPSTTEVDIRDYAYDEETITIKAGDTVVWKNYDSAPHTVTATSGADFDSGKMSNGDTWEYSFTEPGTYEYYCTYHPSMKGTVIVE